LQHLFPAAGKSFGINNVSRTLVGVAEFKNNSSDSYSILFPFPKSQSYPYGMQAVLVYLSWRYARQVNLHARTNLYSRSRYITGATHDECSEMFAPRGHPLEFVIRGFQHIDRAYNQLDLVECIQRLHDIEDKLQNPELHSLAGLTIDLNTLNTKISELRTCVQYIRASMDSILALKSTYSHQEWGFILQTWQPLDSDIISLRKICEQRLLDMESSQQRINISLSVVGLTHIFPSNKSFEAY
jgi:hypothetical protein